MKGSTMFYTDKSDNTVYQVTQFNNDQVVLRIIKSVDSDDIGASAVVQSCALVEPLRSVVRIAFNI
jgi:hypothetical protein